MPWDHDPAMAGWRRALEGWGRELEWTQKVMMDAWLECEGDIWIRWSTVEAIEVQPKERGPDYQILLLTGAVQTVYATKDDRTAARATVIELLQQLSNDHRQSA